jgi:hypothetical protein
VRSRTSACGWKCFVARCIDNIPHVQLPSTDLRFHWQYRTDYPDKFWLILRSKFSSKWHGFNDKQRRNIANKRKNSDFLLAWLLDKSLSMFDQDAVFIRLSVLSALQFHLYANGSQMIDVAAPRYRANKIVYVVSCFWCLISRRQATRNNNDGSLEREIHFNKQRAFSLSLFAFQSKLHLLDVFTKWRPSPASADCSLESMRQFLAGLSFFLSLVFISLSTSPTIHHCREPRNARRSRGK